MNRIHRQATIATGYEKGPRWNGPRLNRVPYRTRSAIGMPGMEANP